MNYSFQLQMPTSFSIEALYTSIGGMPCKKIPLSVVRLQREDMARRYLRTLLKLSYTNTLSCHMSFKKARSALFGLFETDF
jgi:hypothetical protein